MLSQERRTIHVVQNSMVMRIGSTQKELTVSLFTLLFIFTTVFCPGEFLPWECRVPFPGERQLRQSRATQPSVNAEYLCFRNSPNSDMDYRIFNVHKHVNACDCTRGCTDTVRESVLKVDSGRKILRRNGESNLCQRRSGSTLYRLNNIPISIRRSNQQAHTF